MPIAGRHRPFGGVGKDGAVLFQVISGVPEPDGEDWRSQPTIENPKRFLICMPRERGCAPRYFGSNFGPRTLL
jgi:hypothetical protein